MHLENKEPFQRQESLVSSVYIWDKPYLVVLNVRLLCGANVLCKIELKVKIEKIHNIV